MKKKACAILLCMSMCAQTLTASAETLAITDTQSDISPFIITYNTQYDDYTLTWTYDGNLDVLTQVSEGDTVLCKMKYEIDGLRNRKHGNCISTFSYCKCGMLTHEVRNGVTITYLNNMDDLNAGLYDFSGFMVDGETYFYVKDSHNTVTGIRNENQQLVVSYIYVDGIVVGYVPGNTFSSANSMQYAKTIGEFNKIRYRSYYFDDETGFYYKGDGYYDSVNHTEIHGNYDLNDDGV